jgi:hypothetical protein
MGFARMYFVGAVLQGTHPHREGVVEDKPRTDLNRY